MNSMRLSVVGWCVAAAAVLAGVTWNTQAQQAASAPAAARLPKPKTEGGMGLMDALKNRHTSRAFADKKLPDQVLSSLLWAACGVNREDGKRTAPTAMNCQEIDVYVAAADGVWLFDPKAHDLKLIDGNDFRALTGKQDFVKSAPVNLVFVADFAKMGKASDADKVLYSATDTGFVSQNVYLFCASEGLATVVRGNVDRPVLAKAMGLRDDQHIILTQTVGYAAAK